MRSAKEEMEKKSLSPVKGTPPTEKSAASGVPTAPRLQDFKDYNAKLSVLLGFTYFSFESLE